MTDRRVCWQVVESQGQVAQMLQQFLPPADNYIIKPNWSSSHPGNYTEARVLDLLLPLLPGKRLVIEAYSYGRNDGSRAITPENTGENAEWIAQQDKMFLEDRGIQRVLDKHDAGYLNITAEVWAGRTVEPGLIKAGVEGRYSPLHHTELYSTVPRALYEIRRNSVLINLGKIKVVPFGRLKGIPLSLSFKNLFGLIPDPSRLNYHNALPEAIVDTNKIYRSLFPVVNVLEGIYRMVVFVDEGGEVATDWAQWDVHHDAGLLLVSHLPIEIDMVASKLFGADIRDRDVIQLAAQVFGPWDQAVVDQVPVIYHEGRGLLKDF